MRTGRAFAALLLVVADAAAALQFGIGGDGPAQIAKTRSVTLEQAADYRLGAGAKARPVVRSL